MGKLNDLTLWKKKLKQCWSTIPLVSTKLTITSYLNSLNTEKDYDIWHWKSRSWLGTGI